MVSSSLVVENTLQNWGFCKESLFPSGDYQSDYREVTYQQNLQLFANLGFGIISSWDQRLYFGGECQDHEDLVAGLE
jgi:hypothetical protein